MKEEILKQAAGQFGTPCYVFDTDMFETRVRRVSQAFGERVGLCFSIKADPFLLSALPGQFSYVEVCSPGELSICESVGCDPRQIIFSGVNKTRTDIDHAFEYGVELFTAESVLQLRMISDSAVKRSVRVKVLLRLAHGSQFGIEREELCGLISQRETYAGVEIVGLHYFTGTQKTKARTIAKELDLLDGLCVELKEKYGFVPSHIEYGTGLAVEYYKDMTEQTDLSLLAEVSEPVRAFAEKYPLTVEMGRFFAATCGYYLTAVMDLKTNGGIRYAICDGGINQLNYYGQNMAMKIPPVSRLGGGETKESVCLCGSLCTTADVLVRGVMLPELSVGDVLCFEKCGAYSVSEGIAIFLSRALPAVSLYSEKNGLKPARPLTDTFGFNTVMNGGADI